MILDVLGAICLLSGTFICIVGGIGILRMPSFFARAHAASVPDTLGAGLALLGMIFFAISGSWADPSYQVYTWDLKALIVVKLVFIGAFIMISSPIAGHALAKAAYREGLGNDKSSDSSHNWKKEQAAQEGES